MMQLQPFFAECVLPPTIKSLFAAERGLIISPNSLNMVARDGVEPPPAFSVLRFAVF